MSAQAVILLLSDNEDCLRRWMACLAAASLRVITSDQDLADDPRVDVVVTDRPILDFPAGIDSDQIARGNIGVIRVGCPGAADVALPQSATDREVQLSCLLLAQIIHLRRERLESHRIRRVLSHLAFRDPLTGLLNRRAWDEEILRRTVALQDAETILIAVLDLDRFKQVNDNHGHPAGDEVLKIAATALSNGVRDQDIVARLGGDEFGILMTNCQLADAQAVVDRVRRSIHTATQPVAEVTCSAGFAIVAGAKQATDLIAAADGALGEAKRAGRDRTIQARFTRSAGE